MFVYNGLIESTDDNAGLIAGNARGVSAYNCHGTGSVKGYYSVGGLFGNVEILEAGIHRCSFVGDVYGEGWGVGGLIGTAYEVNEKNTATLIKDCYTNATVTGTAYGTGGMIGALYTNTENCFAAGEVIINKEQHSTHEAGGLVGGLYGWGAAGSRYLRNSVSVVTKISNTTGSTSTAYDIAANLKSIFELSNVISLDILEFVETTETINSTQRVSNEQAKLIETYKNLGWDFENVWVMTPNGPGFKVLQVPVEEIPDIEVPDNDIPSDIVIVTDVNFRKTKMLRDHFGTPIPQVWDHENERWVPVTLQMVLFMANS